MLEERDNKRLAAYIRELAQGATDRIDDIYKLAGPKMHGLAARFFPNETDADQAVNDALLKIVLYADRFRREENALGWILTIVSNCAKTQLRADARFRETFSPEEACADDFLDCVVVAELRAGFTAEERELVYYRVDCGFSFAEIGKMMNCPPTTLQYRFSALMKRLGEELEK